MKKLSRRTFLTGLSGVLLVPALPKRTSSQRVVSFRVDLTRTLGPCDPAIWANIGYDPIYAVTVRPENQPFWELVRESEAFRYIRCHNAFSDGRPGDPWPYGCRVYSEDAEGNPRYNWRYLDQVLDIWVRAGLKPILETDFMPDALAEGPIVRNYSYGAINTPKDYDKWHDLVYETIRHCLDRYGAQEVRTWYFEVWNEPDLKRYFIDGVERGEPVTPEKIERFCKLYDYFVAGAKAADPQIKVGGPAIAGNEQYFRAFLNHGVRGRNHATGGRGTPIDFISWHGYGTTESIRQKNQRMKQIVREFPELIGVELQQNEWGQRLRRRTESIYSEYEACFLCRSLDLVFHDPSARVDKFLRWGQPTGGIGRGGWRALTFDLGGTLIKLPIFLAYELLAKLGSERVQVFGPGLESEVRGFATRRGLTSAQVLIYHFDETDEEGRGRATPIQVEIAGLETEVFTLRHYRIDREHSNAYRAWERLGRPLDPTPEQIAAIQAHAQLELLEPPQYVEAPHGQLSLSFELPVNAISLLILRGE